MNAAKRLLGATYAVSRLSRSGVNFINGPNRAFESAILSECLKPRLEA
jgi:hypothetical protein